MFVQAFKFLMIFYTSKYSEVKVNLVYDRLIKNKVFIPETGEGLLWKILWAQGRSSNFTKSSGKEIKYCQSKLDLKTNCKK